MITITNTSSACFIGNMVTVEKDLALHAKESDAVKNAAKDLGLLIEFKPQAQCFTFIVKQKVPLSQEPSNLEEMIEDIRKSTETLLSIAREELLDWEKRFSSCKDELSKILQKEFDDCLKKYGVKAEILLYHDS